MRTLHVLSRGESIDFDAYLERVGYDGRLAPDLDTLIALHAAHASHIPFENLDILLGRGIRLDLPSLEAKLVRGGRGGYCFEQNLLFANVLQTLGFDLVPLAARVRMPPTDVERARTHMLLLVEAGGARWIADVGFGADGIYEPVRFDEAVETRAGLGRYRARADRDAHSHVYVLQAFAAGEWLDLYAFTLEAQVLADYEVANHFVSTHPSSAFVRTLTAQIVRENARLRLRDRELSIEDTRGETWRALRDHDELIAVLSGVFGLRLAANDRFALFESDAHESPVREDVVARCR